MEIITTISDGQLEDAGSNSERPGCRIEFDKSKDNLFFNRIFTEQ